MPGSVMTQMPQQTQAGNPIGQVSGVIAQPTPYVSRSRIYAFVVDETGNPIELGSGRRAHRELGGCVFRDDVHRLAAIGDVAVDADAVAKVHAMRVDQLKGREACRERALAFDDEVPELLRIERSGQNAAFADDGDGLEMGRAHADLPARA